MAGADAPQKVAVLGGGPAAIAAAFELTAQRQNGRFDVTVYQPGWRLGGKCASGRNQEASKCERIEEHGLHIWFGFYENAFRIMREAYDELDRPPEAPLATWEEAFHGCDEIVLYDRQGRGWTHFNIKCPTNDLEPGCEPELPDILEIIASFCRWAVEGWESLLNELADALPAALLDPAPPVVELPELAALFVAGHPPSAEELGAQMLYLARSLAEAPGLVEALALLEPAGPPPVLALLAFLLTSFRNLLWDWAARELAPDFPHLRLFFTMFDVFASGVSGIVNDGVLEDGWPAINHLELCDWLAAHGAKEVTLGATPAERCPLLRAIYDVAFAYPEGDIAAANVAAGTAMNDLLRLVFTYRGHLMYKMQAGMGDTVLTPFYEVLLKRGVKFEFFHVVTNLGLSDDGESVETIELLSQVELTGASYQPLVEVAGLPCWPSTPLWNQLVNGKKLEEEGVNFEQEADPLHTDTTVELVLGQDFDQVVLGIPVGALGSICQEMVDRHPQFKRMLASSVTVATQAFQLWLTETTATLGWTGGENSVSGCFVEPIDTWCDMTHLLPRETWPATERVRAIAYFCGVMTDIPGETPDQATQRVLASARSFLEGDAATLWPQSKGYGNEPFNWSLLAGSSPAADPNTASTGAGAPAVVGPARLGLQYFRANTLDSERYVLTPAGTVEYRLAANESGVENLVLAGDWTSNGIDGGCVEAAVTSGLQAARALTGEARAFAGESPTWLTD